MMDDKDKKIISVLEQNSRLSTYQISKKTLLPVTTVYNRIKKLEKEDIIKKYSIEIDPVKIGKGLLAFIFISADNKKLKELDMTQDDLMKKIKSHESVKNVYAIAGRRDIIVSIRTKDIASLNEILIKHLLTIDGISHTETNIVLNQI